MTSSSLLLSRIMYSLHPLQYLPVSLTPPIGVSVQERLDPICDPMQLSFEMVSELLVVGLSVKTRLHLSPCLPLPLEALLLILGEQEANLLPREVEDDCERQQLRQAYRPAHPRPAWHANASAAARAHPSIAIARWA